jgi:hypothetical protein
MTKFPKPQRVRDKAYIEWIKGLRCCITACPNPDPHHVNPAGGGGMGTKCSDRRAVPLAHWIHQEIHQIGQKRFCEKYKVDFEEVIDGLNKKYEEGG